MKRDGSDQQQITSGEQTDRDPAWSPVDRLGGQRIAFVRGSDLMVVDPNVPPQFRQLGRLMDGYSLGAHPSWAPDGRSVVWESNDRRRRAAGIYRVDAVSRRRGEPAGPPPLRIGGESIARTPAWSPDGNRIAYYKFGVGTCLMSAIGSARLCPPAPSELLDGATGYPTFGPLLDTWEPDWLPDSQSLVVTARAQGSPGGVQEPATFRFEIGPPASAGLPQLGRAGRSQPDVSPDGSLLAFRTGDGQIATGSLTDGSAPWTTLARGSAPDWESIPDGWTFGASPGVGTTCRVCGGPRVGVHVSNNNNFPVSGQGRTSNSRSVRPTATRRRVRRSPRSKAFWVPAHGRRTLNLTVPSAARKRLARGRRVSVQVILRLRDPAGKTRTVRKTLRLRPKRR